MNSGWQRAGDSSGYFKKYFDFKTLQKNGKKVGTIKKAQM